jgi:hypothetical protein
MLDVEGKHILAFEFGHSQNRPHFAGHAYLRIGAASVKASASLLDELIASRNTKAGRLLSAKDRHEHVTLVIPVGADFPPGYPTSQRREWECLVDRCDAHAARFLDIGKATFHSFPLEYLLLSQDDPRDRLLVEYTRRTRP